MIKEVIGTGETEQEALENAKAELGLDDSAEYDFEVVQRAEKKMLGLFGGKPAKVKVTVEIKENPADVAEKFLRDVIGAMNLSELTIEVEKTDDGVKATARYFEPAPAREAKDNLLNDEIEL